MRTDNKDTPRLETLPPVFGGFEGQLPTQHAAEQPAWQIVPRLGLGMPMDADPSSYEPDLERDRGGDCSLMIREGHFRMISRSQTREA